VTGPGWNFGTGSCPRSCLPSTEIETFFVNLKCETTWSSLRLLQLGRGRVLLILLVLVALVSLRVAGVASKNTITHDEGISYLAATGHQGQYNDIVYRTQHPAGAWVKSLEWKKLITPNEQFVFKRIGDDLAHFDIHPPLYFWLLHVWSLLLGVHIWTGPTLNIIIFLVTSLLLFRLAYYVLGSYSQAAIATSVCAISPAVVSTSFTARPYGLAALITVIFIDQIIRYVDLSRLPRLTEFILLSTITAAGVLMKPSQNPDVPGFGGSTSSPRTGEGSS
jgi:hypothetical protein